MAARMVVRTQNQNGQPGIVQAQDAAEVPIAGINLGYEFDAVGNLKRLRDGNQADPPARIYGYDPLNRLTEAKDASDVVWQSYSYDKTGNRQNAGWRDIVPQEDCSGAPPGGPCTPLPPTTQWSTDGYTYHPGTHRLFSRTGRERSYDSAGNLTLDAPMGVAPIDPPPGGGGTESAAYEGTMQAMEQEGGEELPPPGAVSRTYSYNAANRMSGTSLGSEFLMGYRYNGRGERVYRQGADRTVHTVFDESGRWIGDYDGDGAAIQQAIWLGDLPVGLLAKDGGVTRLFHIEADALGSPRVVIDPTRGTNGTVVWRWDLAGEVFGNDKPNEDPDGDNVAFVLDMRYPGQQYDSASELNYNYFRDYDPSVGRYTQSDPIGLNGGISTYGYVSGNPLTNIDPQGLMGFGTPGSPRRSGGGVGGITRPSGPTPTQIYDGMRTWRVWGHRTFPGERNSFERHCTVSCILSKKYGVGITRLSGIVNEYQGFYVHDLWDLSGRYSRQRPWAFQPDDLAANEKGFDCSKKQNCSSTGGDEASIVDECTKCCTLGVMYGY